MTPKQEAFCISYIETGNASEAYRRSYDASKMKSDAVGVEASRLLSSPKISLRVAELKSDLVDRHKVTADTIAEMLREDRDFAREMETPSAAVTATMGLAKLYGLLTDKTEVTGKDGAAIQIEQVKSDAESFTRSIVSIAARTGTPSEA